MATEWISSLGTIRTISPLNLDNSSVGKDTEINATVSFKDFLNEAISKVNKLQIDAQTLSDDFAAGRTDNIHEVMIAAAKADIALQFTLQIRNKIVDAYNEIMRMQI